jgi:catechol 2,3-dioxygenase-like lactoylglutathione lyase family enzyme
MLETVLNVRSMEKTRHFYESVFGLKAILATPVITVFPMDEARSHVLLLFQLGATAEDTPDDSVPGNLLPGHGPTGQLLELLMNRKGEGEEGRSGLRQHYCFAVDGIEEAKAWERYLIEKEVKILGRMDWGDRGYSVYFEDPDGNVGEVASKRLWELLQVTSLLED